MTDRPDQPEQSPLSRDDHTQEVSADRRQFFRQILALGVDRAEQAARAVAHRVADAVEQQRAAEQSGDASASPGAAANDAADAVDVADDPPQIKPANGAVRRG